MPACDSCWTLCLWAPAFAEHAKNTHAKNTHQQLQGGGKGVLSQKFNHICLLASVQIGSPDGGCKPKIAANLFQQNKAKITVRHCHIQSADAR